MAITAVQIKQDDLDQESGIWWIVLAVLFLHLAIIAIFRFGLPDLHRNQPSEISIELGKALPRGDGGKGNPQPAPVTPTKPVPQKTTVQDDNASRKSTETPKVTAPPTPQAPPASAAGVESAPTTDADYKAAFLNNPKPPYPPVAFQLRIEGTVTVKVLVSPEGNPSQVVLGRSSGNDLLDQSALNTVTQWKFIPAKSQGKDISQWVSIPISFNLKRR